MDGAMKHFDFPVYPSPSAGTFFETWYTWWFESEPETTGSRESLKRLERAMKHFDFPIYPHVPTGTFFETWYVWHHARVGLALLGVR
jgi:hypothetical protein